MSSVQPQFQSGPTRLKWHNIVKHKYSTASMPQVCCVGLGGALVFSTMKSPDVQYSSAQYSAVQYSAVQYSAVKHSTVQHSAVRYSTVRHSAVQCSAVQYSTAQHNAAQHSGSALSAVPCS